MAYVDGSEEIVGRSAEGFINESLERFIHPDDKKKANAFFEDLLSGADSRVQARFEFTGIEFAEDDPSKGV